MEVQEKCTACKIIQLLEQPRLADRRHSRESDRHRATRSPNFPTQGAYDVSANGLFDAFVTKLDPVGEACEVTMGGFIITVDGARATFGGNARMSADGLRVQGQQEYQDHGRVGRNVHSIELIAMSCAATDADPGGDDTYGIILSDGYASGPPPLGGGNIRITSH